MLQCFNTNSILLLLLLLPPPPPSTVILLLCFYVIYIRQHSVTQNIMSNGTVIWLRMNRKGHGGRWYWLCLRYYPGRMNRKGHGGRGYWLCLRYHPGSYLQGMRKHIENFSENSHL